MAIVRTVDFTITRGMPWKRVLIVKNIYRRRIAAPQLAKAKIQLTPTSKKSITAEVSGAGEILLSLTADETRELPLGNLKYDVLATYKEVAHLVAQGTITVLANDRITDEDEAQSMELRITQREDFRKTFTWKDSAGVLIAINSAYLQAKDTAGVTVLDLRWFSATPSEETIVALPAIQRGYLAPKSGTTLEMHISDKNTVTSGTHNFDLFVQDTALEWTKLASGVLLVTSSISTNPY